MNRTALALIACLATLNTAVAQRTLEVVESAAELTLSHVVLPASESGTVTIKACGTCPSELHRVTSATRYLVDGSELPLADFVGVADLIRETRNADERTLVGVFVDRASGNVTRIALLRPR